MEIKGRKFIKQSILFVLIITVSPFKVGLVTVLNDLWCKNKYRKYIFTDHANLKILNQNYRQSEHLNAETVGLARHHYFWILDPLLIQCLFILSFW